MKKPFLFLLFLVPLLGSAQMTPPEVYADLGFFYEDEFEPSVYVKFSAGTELFSYKFIAPEIDVSYYAGGDQDEDFEIIENKIGYKSILNRSIGGFVFGLAPKLFINDDNYRYVLIPKYNFGNIKATGRFLDSENLRIEQEAMTKVHFWSFALGIEGKAYENGPNMGMYLIYTRLNGGPALQQLDFEENGYPGRDYSTKAIGLLLRISTDFGRKKPLE